MSWTPDLPRFRLFDEPSPLYPLPRFSQALGGRTEIWIKREDLLPLAFGGNKLRNLEFLIGDAIARGADALVTEGRRWSNHCRLTAAAGAKAGLQVHLVLSGPPRAEAGVNQRLDELLGATIHLASSADSADRARLADEVIADLEHDGRRPYRIPVGGGGVTGVVGQVIAGQELVDQARAQSIEVASIVLPSSSGGTQAGILVGLDVAGSVASVVGICVAHVAATLRPAIDGLLAELGALTGASVEAGDVTLEDAFLGPGYGIRSPAAEDATRLLARTEGILVDPIYTAKALAGLIALGREGTFDGQRVVFWHAGGTPGLFEDLD